MIQTLSRSIILEYRQDYYKISIIMKVGQDVLSKIQKLITQIDRPKAKKPRPPPPSQKENINNDLYVKLHEQHKAKMVRHAMKVQQKIDDETQRCSPFKVTNKHTIFLNSQQPKRPLHERIEELQQQKLSQLLMLKEKYQPKESFQNDEEEQIAREMEERRKTQRKYTPRQVADKMAELNKRQRQRIQKLNRLKIQMIEEHSKDFRCKPYVSRQTEALWNRYKLKKQLSTSVFERFQQYQIDRKAHLENKQKQIRSQITPFAPKISQNSRLIASRSTTRLDVKSRSVSRSASCKCFQRTRKHNRSTAMHTSRKI